jgi:uncharacterized protein YecT (DUF1311 family)
MARLSVNTAFLCIFTLFAASTVFAQTNVKAEKECYKIGSSTDGRACLERQVELSDLDMKQAEFSLRRVSKEWEKDPIYQNRTDQALSYSSELFERYKNAQCELQASLAAEGNAAGNRRLSCLVELNRRRINELATIQKSLR